MSFSGKEIRDVSARCLNIESEACSLDVAPSIDAVHIDPKLFAMRPWCFWCPFAASATTVERSNALGCLQLWRSLSSLAEQQLILIFLEGGLLLACY